VALRVRIGRYLAGLNGIGSQVVTGFSQKNHDFYGRPGCFYLQTMQGVEIIWHCVG
jgi:hypothetical protein